MAAQGAGKVVLPIQVTAFTDRDASTAQSAAVSLWISSGGETVVGNFGYFKRFMRLTSGDRIQSWYLNNAAFHGTADDNTSIDNEPLTAKLDGAITSGSIDACKLVVTYHVYDNS